MIRGDLNFFLTYDPKEQNLNVANKKRWWTKSYPQLKKLTPLFLSIRENKSYDILLHCKNYTSFLQINNLKITSQIFFTSDLTLKFIRHQKLNFYFLKQSLFTHNFWSNAMWSLWCCGLKVKQWVHQQRCNPKNHANLISQDI